MSISHVQSVPVPAVKGKRNLIVISKTLDVYQGLMNCMLPNVEVFAYDQLWTNEIFMENFNGFIAGFEDNTFDNAGWIFHGQESKSAFTFTSDHIIALTSDNLTNEESVSSSFNHICIILNMIKPKMKYGRFDLIACCLALNPKYIMVKNFIENRTQLSLASSSDATGNEPGGNWILESHGINLIGLYFKPNTNEVLGDLKVSLGKTGATYRAITDVSNGCATYPEGWNIFYDDIVQVSLVDYKYLTVKITGPVAINQNNGGFTWFTPLPSGGTTDAAGNYTYLTWGVCDKIRYLDIGSLTVSTSEASTPFNVTVRFLDQYNYEVKNVYNATTIFNLKQEIAKQSLVPVQSQRLFYNDTELINTKNFGDYKIRQDVILMTL